MAKLFYSAITSLDGYIEDRDGRFDRAVPDEEAHSYINVLERNVGTYLYGRRMYETMAAWETEPAPASRSPAMTDFARIWQAAEKVVYSTTLGEVATTRTRIEPSLDPSAVRRMKAAAGADLSIGGPTLAAHALRAGLVDECHLFVAPVAVGAGKRALPADVRLELALLGLRRFDSGMLHLHYRVET